METNEQITQEIPEKIASGATSYIERLEAGHDKLANGISNLRARNARVTDKVIETMLANQREALRLGKTVIAEPTAFGKNMQAMMESLTAAQERAIDVAKTVYREQAEATTEIRGALEKSFDGAKGFTKPFEQMTSAWKNAVKS